MTLIRCVYFCCFTMASYFGEIIEPSTRAICDDFSDDEDSSNSPELQLSWANPDEKLPSVFDVIFVIHGRLSLAFAELYLLDEKSSPTAEINIVETNKDVDRDADRDVYDHVKILPSRIYIDKRKAIVLVSPSYSPELGYQFTETITPLLKISKKVFIITNDSLYNYKVLSTHDLPAAFIRELKTSYNTSKYIAQHLPTPNFITGIPAAVISWCQIFQKDASALICYSDQEKLDSITATPYLSAFKKIGFNMIKNENPDFKKSSFYGKPETISESSNIYL